MKTDQFWAFVAQHLATGQPIGLLVVVQSNGSSPGRQGFKMAIAPDGTMTGSVGGGIMEHKFVTLVSTRLQAGESFLELRHQIHSKEVPHHQSGMICSGEQTIVLMSLADSDLPTIQAIQHSLQTRQPSTFQLSPLGLQILPQVLDWHHFTQADPETWQYTERIAHKDIAFVVGAGHVGLEMCKVLALLDFYVITLDDRAGLNTLEANHWAHEKIVTPYDTIADFIPAAPNHYVIIMTFGYRTDAIALRQLLGRDYPYLGMMGSKAKVTQLLSELRTAGIPDTHLQKLHSPAGLPIASKTPAEIAISIAAEIIAIKNKG